MKLQKLITISLLTLGLLTSLAPTTFGQETEKAPSNNATPDEKPVQACKNKDSEAHKANLAIINNGYSNILEILETENEEPTSFTKPTTILGSDQLPYETSDNALWQQASPAQRTNYCGAIDYLTNFIKLAQSRQIANCSAQQVGTKELNELQDNRCKDLLFKAGTPNQYYDSSIEANIDRRGNKDGTINEGNESCQLKLPASIDQCTECLKKIRAYQSNNELKEPSECKDYVKVNNCNLAYACIGDSSEPTKRPQSPFGTEFFDVTDSQKGLNSQDQKNQNFNPNITGGPIIGTINTVANFLVRMISVLSLLVFIIGAFILITANGEENQLNRGKDAIKLSLVGIVIVMLSYTIVVLIQSIFF